MEKILNDNITSEYEVISQLFSVQSSVVKHFINTSSRKIALDLIDGKPWIILKFPDQIYTDPFPQGWPRAFKIPEDVRTITIGSKLSILDHRKIKDELNSRLWKLEHSPDKSIAICAALYRYSIALNIIEYILPDGNEAFYSEDLENSPSSQPTKLGNLKSSLTSSNDAVYGGDLNQADRGELQVPFVPDAQKFFLPQWVSFDLKGNLLTKDTPSAEANFRSLQKYFTILHLTSSLAPYMVLNPVYQHKRDGIIGQLINQGRALAKHINESIIFRIIHRTKNGTLNRGLSLSLPYFDDQEMKIAYREIQVIPAGRILFIPAFIGRAVNLEVAKVWQDTRLGLSTKLHLVEQLETLGNSFNSLPKR